MTPSEEIARLRMMPEWSEAPWACCPLVRYAKFHDVQVPEGSIGRPWSACYIHLGCTHEEMDEVWLAFDDITTTDGAAEARAWSILKTLITNRNARANL